MARDWFEDQPIGKTAGQLWNRGYAFDYVSDRQLRPPRLSWAELKWAEEGLRRVVVVPPTQHLPVETLRKLLELAESGATVIFETICPPMCPAGTAWKNGGLSSR